MIRLSAEAEPEIFATTKRFGTGQRMPIRATRARLNAALDGAPGDAAFRTDPLFGFRVPVAGVDGAVYDRAARTLVGLFVDNFAQFEAHVDDGVRQAAPRAA